MKLALAGIFVAGAVVGGVGVYWATNKPMKDKYEAILEQEIADVKSHYRVIHKDDYPTPGDLLKEKGDEVAEDMGGYLDRVSAYELETERQSEMPPTKPRDKNVFDLEKATEELIKNGDAPVHDPNNPIYMVTFEQFDREEEHHTKTTLTYYHGDDTLTDEIDQIIEDVAGYIGVEALGSFGFDPEHPDAVYVRNHAMKSDFEVLYEDRKSSEVIG